MRRRFLLPALAAVAALLVSAAPASALSKAQCTSYINKYQSKAPVSGSGEPSPRAACSAAPAWPTAWAG